MGEGRVRQRDPRYHKRKLGQIIGILLILNRVTDQPPLIVTAISIRVWLESWVHAILEGALVSS